MVVRRKKYQTGEASNFVTRKQALHKLQLNLKVSNLDINEMKQKLILRLIFYLDQLDYVIFQFFSLGFSKIMYPKRNTSKRASKSKESSKRRFAYYKNIIS